MNAAHTKPNQRGKILRHMRDFGSITPLQALDLFGCNRLAARIYEIRAMGIPVSRKLEGKGDSRYARYSLAATPQLA